MNNPSENIDFELCLLTFIAETLACDSVSDKVRELRLNALKQLQSYLNHYKKLGYMDTLLNAIAEKKGRMILQTSSETEMNKLLKPHCPHFDGVNFIPDKYHVPEEELICWSETSLKAPLNHNGFKRYAELFKQVFPDKSKEIFPQ